MSKSQYSLSFTTGASLFRESLALAELKKDIDDWKTVKSKAIEENILQARTESTSRKLCGEVIRRLKHLSTEELDLLSEGQEDEQRHLVWLSICRHYRLIKDFAIEVLSQHYDSSNYGISHHDYDVFFNAKADWHDNLHDASDLTKSKARQVLFKMLRESGLINEQDEIVNQNVSERLLELIRAESRDDVRIYPGMGS